uniref:Proteasome alpha-type subunits domain-containing protein n=1 Tax=Rhinolophus ferrumequinum TaxID=59479 RepID=A0A671EBF3_RHIFE
VSSVGTGYELSASTFSPDGRPFQVEYAMKSVENSRPHGPKPERLIPP